jgi:hypothetical protein
MLVMVLGLILLLGVQAAHADLIFDRGLPTANLNNAANPNRSNISLLSGPYADSNPPTYQVWGDDCMISGSGTYHVDTLRVWLNNGSTTPTNLKLWGGKAGDSLSLVSTDFSASIVTYQDGQKYERFLGPSGIFIDMWQINFTINHDMEAGQKYLFFVDGPILPRYTSGVLDGYFSPYLHLSNAALSGSTQAGADNYVLRLTIAGGVPGAIVQFDAVNSNFRRSVDANVQLYGYQVAPLPSTLWLLGSGFLGLMGLGRFRKS